MKDFYVISVFNKKNELVGFFAGFEKVFPNGKSHKAVFIHKNDPEHFSTIEKAQKVLEMVVKCEYTIKNLNAVFTSGYFSKSWLNKNYIYKINKVSMVLSNVD